MSASAHRTVTIKITDEHIENGMPGDVENCPVAIAANEATGLVCEAGSAFITVFQDGDGPLGVEPEAFATPREVRDWISCYDRGLFVSPIEFELTLPPREKEKGT